MEALKLLLTAAALAWGAPAKDEVFLKIHSSLGSVWVNADTRGTLTLREDLPPDIARRPRDLKKKVKRDEVRRLIQTAEKEGFFELEPRYVEPGENKTSFRAEITRRGAKKAVSVYGTPPPAFRAVVDGMEKLYGKPLIPGLALPKPKLAAPGDPDRDPEPLPKGKAGEWED